MANYKSKYTGEQIESKFDLLEDKIKKLIHKKKTFYVMLFDESGLCKDMMKFEKGKRQF